MLKSLTVPELKKKCKELQIKGYSKLRRADLEKLLLQHEPSGVQKQPNDTQQKKKDQVSSKQIQLLQIKPLPKQKFDQISQYFRNPPSHQQFCKHKSKYEMNKLMLKTKYEILLSYYHYNNPCLRNDPKVSTTYYRSHQFNIPQFLTYGLEEAFYPLDRDRPVTIHDFMDQEWFVKQNEFIKSLSSFQRAFLFAYSNNSFDTITPFLLESTKPKPNYKESFKKYVSWFQKKKESDWVHPLLLSLIMVSQHSHLQNQYFPKTKKAKELFDKIKKGDLFSTPAIKQVIRDYVKEKHFEFLMNIYIRVLKSIFDKAPPLQKSIYLFRVESQFRYDELLKEKKTSIKNCTFTSTSIDQEYILDRSGKEYIRFRMSPGTNALFIRGCSYFKKENEFVIPPSNFHNIRKNVFSKSADICSAKTTIYDIDVSPL